MLTEDTEEHREILGPDGECVLYFRQIDDMIVKARLTRANDAWSEAAQCCHSFLETSCHSTAS